MSTQGGGAGGAGEGGGAGSDGVGLVSSARPLLISEVSATMSRVADGSAAPTQLSTLRAASRHARYGSFICVDHVLGIR